MLVSTGSTAATLVSAGLPVTEVAEVTGFPESLDGRVKTLHPAIHAGLLADLNRPEHAEQLAELGIAPFELVVSSLYPFERTVASGAEDAAVIEQIDIGGPALVRAAAKNHANVAVVTSVAQYDGIVAALDAGGTTLAERRALAAAAFGRIADYDLAIANWFARAAEPEKAEAASTVEGDYRFTVTPLRYGENAHQSASLWREPAGRGLAQAVQLHGREMSYNNYVDADAAVRAVLDFDEPAVAVVKHANPCGIAVAPPRAPDPIAAAHRRANDCDPVSAFGGVIAANRTVTLGYGRGGRADLHRGDRRARLRARGAPGAVGEEEHPHPRSCPRASRCRRRSSGRCPGACSCRSPTASPRSTPRRGGRSPARRSIAETLADLVFAWKACRSVKSNAILLADHGAAVGIGMGQVNRVDSCHLAVTRAGQRAAGSVAASDAYFPFADGAQVLLDAGVRAIVQPGGSVRDAEVIAAVEAAGVAMLLTGERHFFH